MSSDFCEIISSVIWMDVWHLGHFSYEEEAEAKSIALQIISHEKVGSTFSGRVKL